MTRKINYDGKFIPPDEPEAIDAFLDAAYAHIPTSADVEQRDVELDHAVAAERNRIADWLVDTRCITPAVANVIRNGAHWRTHG